MNKDPLIFSCSFDKFSKIITFLLSCLCIAAFLLSGSELLGFIEDKTLAGLLTGTFLAFILFITFGYAPRAYKIEKGNIIICRYFGNKTIEAGNIIAVRIPTEHEINWPLRKFGNGGIFGYTGRYYTKHIGNMIWHCSRRSQYILIQRKAGYPVVISPDDQHGFLETFQRT